MLCGEGLSRRESAAGRASSIADLLTGCILASSFEQHISSLIRCRSPKPKIAGSKPVELSASSQHAL